MHRKFRLPTSATLALMTACAHGGGREAGTPPVLVSPTRSAPELNISPESFESWKSIQQEVIELGGKRQLAIVGFTQAGDNPEIIESSRELVRRLSAEHLRALVAKAKGVPEDETLSLEPPPLAKEVMSNGKVYQLALCDETCLSTAIAASGGAMEAPQALEAIAKLRANAAAAAEREKAHEALAKEFRDLDPKKWVGPGPWWLEKGTQIVSYIDGERVLIAVGHSSKNETSTGTMDSSQRRTTASNRARNELAKGFTVTILRKPEGTETSSELKLVGTNVDAVFERGDDTHALAICDSACIQKNAERLGASLPPEFLGAAK